MLTEEQTKKIKIKLLDMGERQNYLARKFKVTPQKICNVLNRKRESIGLEIKLLDWLGKE